jgi:hypothetical protein
MSKKEEPFMAPEYQSIRMYAPRSNIFVFPFMGVLFLSLAGVAFVFADHQIAAYVLSVCFTVGGFWFLSLPWWKLIHTPTLIIDSEGIRSYHPFNRWEVKWEEIDAIYSHSHRTAFAIDLSPTGLRAYFSRQGGRIPRWLDPMVPQQVLANQGTNLALPIDQLLAQIREKFAVQLERYHIELDDGNA